MLDFLGKEFDVGDLIVYPMMSGRSVALVKGRVLKFNDSGSVGVQPETESWRGGRERSGTTRYIDSRSGKGFSPYSEPGKKHMERDYGYIRVSTGEWISYDDYEAQRDSRSYFGSDPDIKWAPVIWKDYVKIESKVKPVTITRTDNIILIEKASE